MCIQKPPAPSSPALGLLRVALSLLAVGAWAAAHAPVWNARLNFAPLARCFSARAADFDLPNYHALWVSLLLSLARRWRAGGWRAARDELRDVARDLRAPLDAVGSSYYAGPARASFVRLGLALSLVSCYLSQYGALCLATSDLFMEPIAVGRIIVEPVHGSTELDSAIPARESWRPRLDGDITINIVLPVEKTTHQLDFAHDAPVPLVKARVRASRRDPSHSSRIPKRALAFREVLPLLVPPPREQERLAERTGVDASSQRLIYRNRVLDDPEARLASAGARARGGGRARSLPLAATRDDAQTRALTDARAPRSGRRSRPTASITARAFTWC